ncbi:twin-arginine translocase TatA/TatE family subunit [Desulfoscipio gibsoniae]|uniref:Sec-independent protein translocase protein TatA n=1 Tax=Desulfoscipio gibsoniae DSM 7213 TaxID=767817 RepID=R4KIV7_9FIRM|nr:twin-arginine translocase TatA/TatE family subunit [Desulfoscipio gibsoniae]AGL00470.1 twin arginine-targeting protein translocase, TatA/E family [Desulfoscipio gibsoniae DSM 7213]
MFSGFFQPTHLILILVVVLIVFGPGKLPDAAKAMGKALRDMRNSFAEDEEKKESKPSKEGIVVATKNESGNASATVQNAPQSTNLQ